MPVRVLGVPAIRCAPRRVKFEDSCKVNQQLEWDTSVTDALQFGVRPTKSHLRVISRGEG